MSIFDQRGQRVGQQYNAAGDINLGTVHNVKDLATELEKLKIELSKAVAEQVVDSKVATNTAHHLTKAIQQAEKSEPDKKTILDHINKAKVLIEGITAAAGMVTTLAQASELVRRLL